MAEERELVYSILSEKDLVELLFFQPALFTANEPSMMAAGVTADQERMILDMYIPNFLKSNCSFIARDGATGEMIGFCLAYDNSFPDPHDVAVNVGEWIRRYWDLYYIIDDYMQDRYELMDPRLHDHGQILYICYLGVKPGPNLRRGVGSGMVRRTIEQGIALGYRAVYCESSGHASQTLFKEKFGFKEVWAIQYEDYSYHGDYIYAGCAAEGHSRIELLERWLQEDLPFLDPQKNLELKATYTKKLCSSG